MSLSTFLLDVTTPIIPSGSTQATAPVADAAAQTQQAAGGFGSNPLMVIVMYSSYKKKRAKNGRIKK